MMDLRTRQSIKNTVSAMSDLVVIDEKALQKAVGRALGKVLASDEVLKLLNEELGGALESSGLSQFNSDDYLVAVGSIGLGAAGGFVVEVIGPGVGPSKRMTTKIK